MTADALGVRSLVYRGALGQLHDIRMSGHDAHDWSGERRLIFPYAGAFDCEMNGRRRVCDANSALITASSDRVAFDPYSRAAGYSALVLTPSPGLWARLDATDLCGDDVAERRRAIPLPVRLALRRMANAALPATHDRESDRALFSAVRQTLDARYPQTPREHSPTVERAKQLLNEYGSDRISIGEVADRVGVCGVYLTQQFKRWEGVPLYRYHLRLRLSRALLELPGCDDITALALDLGFSSHSHFSASFKSAFGLTPSDYRCEPRSLQ